jgi:hypothetical protein
MHKNLISRNSSIPHLDASRPRPEAFTPLDVATSDEKMPVLAETIPYSNASLTHDGRNSFSWSK